jgi:hypothetical protein
LIQRNQDPLGHRLLGENLPLGFRPIAPNDLIGFAEPSHLVDPAEQVGVPGRRGSRAGTDTRVGHTISSCATQGRRLGLMRERQGWSADAYMSKTGNPFEHAGAEADAVQQGFLEGGPSQVAAHKLSPFQPRSAEIGPAQ